MRAYFLKTARIGFSAWQAEDLPFAVGLWCDPAVAGMICARGCFTQQEAADRLRLEMENLCRYGVQYYPLFLLENDVFIGCCGLRPGSVPREFELGFHLKPAYWGKGLGFEAAKAAVEYGFSKCHADVICAGHHPKNAGSARLLARLGFVYTGDAFYAPTGLHHPTYRLAPPTAVGPEKQASES